MTPLAEVAALGFTSPLFATVLAVAAPGEPVGWRRIVSLLVGFGGALLIIRPGFHGISLVAGLVLLSSLAWAAALIDIKVLSRTELSLRITAYATYFLIPITLACALPFWRWPNAAELLWLVIVGGLGSLTQMSVAQAFRAGDTTQVLPGDFTKLIWAALIGWLVFAEVPDLWTLLAGCLIFASVAFITLREAWGRRGQAGKSVGRVSAECDATQVAGVSQATSAPQTRPTLIEGQLSRRATGSRTAPERHPS